MNKNEKKYFYLRAKTFTTEGEIYKIDLKDVYKIASIAITLPMKSEITESAGYAASLEEYSLIDEKYPDLKESYGKLNMNSSGKIIQH